MQSVTTVAMETAVETTMKDHPVATLKTKTLLKTTTQLAERGIGTKCNKTVKMGKMMIKRLEEEDRAWKKWLAIMKILTMSEAMIDREAQCKRGENLKIEIDISKGGQPIRLK